MTKWQYLAVILVEATNWSSKADSEKQTWDSTYYIWHPGVKEPEERSSRDTDWQAIANELGIEGWEMVAQTVLETTIYAQHYGWRGVGAPVKTRWIYKRVVP